LGKLPPAIATMRSIVVVDDDPDDLELICEAFTSADAKVIIHAKSSGSQLFNSLSELSIGHLPSLFVVDYNMPEMSGAEVIAKLSSIEKFIGIPKVILSTSDSPYYKQVCKENGADHYFKKPYTFPEFIDLAGEMIALIK
jgi:CheY-like chemotaxis protein